MEFADFEIGNRSFKIIEKIAKDEFDLVDMTKTLRAARVVLRKINAERDGCFFIRYPKWALEKEPPRSLPCRT